jgi:hypothetical protein
MTAIIWRAPGSGAEMLRITSIIFGLRYIRRPDRPPSKDIVVGRQNIANYGEIQELGRIYRCRLTEHRSLSLS